MVAGFGPADRGAPRDAETGTSSTAVFPLGVQLLAALGGVELFVSLGVPFICTFFVGDAVGVDWRSGDGDTGDSGLRKGELRWPP